MTERLGLPVRWTTTRSGRPAEHRAGAPWGPAKWCCFTLGTGIGGGSDSGRPALPGGRRLPRVSLATWVVDLDRARACYGDCPSRGCSRRWPRVPLWPAQAREAARPSATVGLGTGPGRRSGFGGFGWSRAGPRRRSGGDRRPAADRGSARRGDRSAWSNIFNPEVVVIGGGVIGAGELLLGPPGRRWPTGPASLARRCADRGGPFPAWRRHDRRGRPGAGRAPCRGP